MHRLPAASPPLLALALALGLSMAGMPAVAADGAPALMLAERYRVGIDVAAYRVSEKLDGVRALWDGRTLRFRSGQPIAAPTWFLAGLPLLPLDGELWLGRGRFDELSGLVRRQDAGEAGWRELRYMVFDLPGGSGPFGERAERLQALVRDAGLPWLQVVPQFGVAGPAELRATLEAVLAGGGEGLMLHRADAHWQPGRSDALLKLTPWLDAEARVVAHLPGRGKYASMVGALEVETADGRRFRVGSGLSDADRRRPPPVGSQISYRYRELGSGGLPRFPVYMRPRLLP
jgi:DNA ligase-1